MNRQDYLYEYLKLHDLDEDSYDEDDFQDYLADVREQQENA